MAQPASDSAAAAELGLGAPPPLTKSAATTSPVPELVPDLDSPSHVTTGSPDDAAPTAAPSVAVMNASSQDPNVLSPPGLSRAERSFSLPPPSMPKPPRRRTLEHAALPTFYSTAAPEPSLIAQQQQGQQLGMSSATAQPLASTSAASTSQQQQQQVSTFSMPTPAAGTAPWGSFWNPACDHPLTAPEQEDTLDRLRRGFVGIDLAAVGEPMRSFALKHLAGSGPSSSNNALAASTIANALKKPILVASENDDALRRTVSPKEAFLDFGVVDSRLHPHGGAAAPESLFAQMPSRPAALGVKPESSKSKPRQQQQRVSDGAAASFTPTKQSQEMMMHSPSPDVKPNNPGSSSSAQRRRFDVPFNAVNWQAQGSGEAVGTAPGSADSSPNDEGADPFISNGGQAKPYAVTDSAVTVPAPPPPLATSDRGPSAEYSPAIGTGARHASEPLVNDGADDTFYDVDAEGEVDDAQAVPFGLPQPISQQPLDDELAHLYLPAYMTDKRPAVDGRGWRFQDETDAEVQQRAKQVAAKTNAAAAAGSVGGGAANGRPRPLDAGKRPQSGSAAQRPPKKKRPVSPSDEDAAYIDDDDAAGVDVDAEGESGDADWDWEDDDDDGDFGSRPKSKGARKSIGGGGGGGGGGDRPPHKRRRREPPIGGRSSPPPSGTIFCDFELPAGGICGVVFRRPYDLARHKDTIHGVGGSGKKGAGRKEWACQECGGTFSRKDALIRHGRTRNHDIGV